MLNFNFKKTVEKTVHRYGGDQTITEEVLDINKIVRWAVMGILAIFVLSTVLSSFYTVKSTERGVLSTFGKIQERTVKDGLHFKIPFVQSVDKVNVQQKKFDGEEDSYTRDVQTSVVQYTINYDLVQDNVAKLMKNVGDDYHNRIVVPYVRSAIKSSFGNFNATQIVENRDKVRSEIEAKLRTTLDSRYFTNIHFQLVNIDFDDQFETAIKDKQVAEQNALKAKNVTIQVEEQAKQTKIRAEAEAEAIRIKSTALERNPKLVEYEAVQKWNGQLPSVTGGAVPFINFN